MAFGTSGLDPQARVKVTPTNGGGNSPQGLSNTGGSPATGQAGNAYAQGGYAYQGQEHPFASLAGVQGAASNILPDIYRQPFRAGMEAAGTTGSYAAAALPGASQFQQGLYSENLNPFESNMLNSSAYLGSLGLEQVTNKISDEYALDPYNSGKNKAYYDAANQFAGQMMQTGAQMGLDRMSLATQNLSNVFTFPNQAAQYGQQSAAGLYNAYDQALYGDLKLPYNMWANYPIQGSTYVQPAAGGK